MELIRPRVAETGEKWLSSGSFYGQTRAQRQIAGWLFSESIYAPDQRIPTHAHDNAFFYFVVHGTSTEVYGTRTRAGATATLVFHPAGEPHANHWHGEGGRCFHIEIAPAMRERARQHSLLLDAPADFRSGLPVWLAARLYREFHRVDTAAPLAMEGLALELLAEASRRPDEVAERTPPRWLNQARELLHDRFAESLSLDDIAAAVGVHPAHLARVFRRQYGCTVGDYVRRLRVEFACRQISTTDVPLVEISLDAGFADQSHFTGTFKRLIGMTPVEFQRNFRVCKAQTRK